MNGVNIGSAIDEGDLEDELEALQQEQLDEQMLKTGTVPVSDAVQRLPAAANGERKKDPASRTRPRLLPHANIYDTSSQQEDPYCRRRRRRRRAQEAPGGNGHVDHSHLICEPRECRILGSLGRRGGICFRPHRIGWSVTCMVLFIFIPAILVGDNKSLELLLVHLAYYLLQLPFFLSRFGRQDVASASHWYSVFDAGNRRRSSVTDRLSHQYAHCLPISRLFRAGEPRVHNCFIHKSRGEVRAPQAGNFILVRQ